MLNIDYYDLDAELTKINTEIKYIKTLIWLLHSRYFMYVKPALSEIENEWDDIGNYVGMCIDYLCSLTKNIQQLRDKIDAEHERKIDEQNNKIQE